MRKILSTIGPGLLATIVFALATGCDSDSGPHRVGDVYERNNMPSADPDRPAGPHSLSDDSQGDHQVLQQSR